MFLRLFLCLAVVTLIAGSYLALVSRTAAQGRHIQQLEQQLFDIRRDNEHIEVQVAEEGSVQRLLERAREKNFILADKVDFLTVPGQ